MIPVRRTTVLQCLAGLTLLAAVGCELGPTGPHNDQVTVAIVLESSEVAPGDALGVTLVLTNVTSRVVAFETTMGCVAVPRVFKDQVQLGWDGADFGCLAAMGRHEIPPRGTLVRQYEIRVPHDEAEYPHLPAPAPGMYQVFLDLQTSLPDQLAEFTVLADRVALATSAAGAL